MFKLIVKDLLIQKKYFLFIVLFSLIGLFFVHSHPAVYYAASSTIIAYCCIMTAIFLDDKNNSQLLLNSLPIRRRDIVLAKYLSVIVYTAAGLAATALIGGLASVAAPSYAVRPAGFFDIIASLGTAIILCSIYFPIYFKLINARALAPINMFLLCFVINIFMQNVMGFSNPYNKPPLTYLLTMWKWVPDWALAMAVMVIGLAFMSASLIISSVIYQNKDL